MTISKYTSLVLLVIISACCTPVADMSRSFSPPSLKVGKKFIVDNSCSSIISTLCDEQLDQAILNIRLNTGEIYNYGNNPFQSSLSLILVRKLSGSSAVVEESFALKIDHKSPEILFQKDITDWYSATSDWKAWVEIATYKNHGIIGKDLLLEIYVNKTKSVSPLNIVDEENTLVSDFSRSSSFVNPMNFSWECPCDFPQYEFQLVKLHNLDTSFVKSNGISTTIDWTNATSILVSEKQIELTIGEGSGYYAWRVRPISSRYDGDFGDDRNWGVWNVDRRTTIIRSPTSSKPRNIFYHESIDDQQNWTFSRFFSEQSRQAEQVTFYNGLLFEKQTQRHLFTDNINLIQHRFYDFSGRPSLSSLAVPINFETFKYQDTILLRDGQLFGPEHFDANANYLEPFYANGGLIHNYWSDNNSDLRIPNAGGYPFSRTLFYPDGTKNPQELSNVGRVHKLGGGRTIKTYFSDAKESELISMFGDEAPRASEVFKTTVVDPHGTTTVSYTDKTGKKLATHLLLNQSKEELITTLPSSIEAMQTTSQEVTFNERIDEFTIKSSEKITLTAPTNVDIYYQITPGEIEEECLEYCQTCDYEIDVFWQNLDDNSFSVLKTKTFTPVDCVTDGGDETWRIETTVTLPAGNHLIGRFISTNNENLLTREAYLEEHLSKLNAKFDSDQDSQINVLVDELETYDLDGFYQLIRSDFNVKSEDDSLIRFETECCSFEIPIIDCEEICPETGQEYEDFLINIWGPNSGKRQNFGCSVYEYFYDPLKLLPDLAESDGKSRSKYPRPRRGDFYGDFPAIDLNGSPLSSWMSFNIMFELKSCSGLISIPSSEWTESGFFFSSEAFTSKVFNEIVTLLTDRISSKYKTSLTSKNEIRLWPAFTAATDAFVSPEATASLSITGEDFNYNHEIDIELKNNDGLFPAGNGAFAQLIDNMLSDGYDACDLWYCWQGLVQSYDVLSFEDGDPTGKRKDFDLLESFLSCAGKQYQGVTECHYEDDCSEVGGYLDNAHKYFYYEPGSSDCEETFEISSWPPDWDPDPIDGEMYADEESIDFDCEFSDLSEFLGTSSNPAKSWEEFYTCLTSSTEAVSEMVSDAVGIECSGTGRDCLVEVLQTIEDTCLTYCEQRLDGFYQEVLWYYESIDEDVDSCIALCKAYTMVDSCKKNCYVELEEIMDVRVWDMTEDELENADLDYEDILNSDNICEVVEGLVASMTHEWEFEEPILCTKGITDPWVDLELGDNNEIPRPSDVLDFDKEYCCPEEYELYYDYVFYDLLCWVDSLNSFLEKGGIINDESMLGNILAAFVPEDQLIQYRSCLPLDHAMFPISLPESKFYLFEPCILKVVTGTGDYLICDQFECLKICPVCIKTAPPEFTPINVVELEPCPKESAEYLANILEGQLEDCRDRILNKFETSYLSNCADPANINDSLSLSYSEARYHYTLYYYDRAGNRVATIPPKGALVSDTYTRMDHPEHTFKTVYNYNSLGQLVQGDSPDGGTTTYIYNDIGLLRFSQNARQNEENKFSYLKYDELGRIIESGEYDPIPADLFEQRNNLEYPEYVPGDPGTERTFTVYTAPATITYLDGSSQRFLRNNVSYTYNDDEVYTYYSYDPHNNVEWMCQDIPGLGQNYIKYDYDLISSLVTKISYNEGLPDAFYHRYSHDADSRITEVETSVDGAIWDTDARYEYYGHGPLQRTTLGEDMVQGLDYIYTIQRWLKSINHHSLDGANDPGEDGVPGGAHSMVAKDVHAVTLGYYPADFEREYASVESPFKNTHSTSLTTENPLYDGNISKQVFGQAVSSSDVLFGDVPTAFQYNYDELGRLLKSTFNYYSGSTWQTDQKFKSKYSYDPNGNIDSLIRYGSEYDGKALVMDSLAYTYSEGNNQLKHVDDHALDSYDNDLKDQSPNNYDYDALGNMIKDDAAGITNIEWNRSGKVRRIQNADGSALTFGYDPMGNRAWKTFSQLGEPDANTFYVRNVTGDPLTIYPNFQAKDNATDVEWLIYGQKRIGQRNGIVEKMEASPSTLDYSLFERKLGEKTYELTNHLGNVQTIITDLKLSSFDALYTPTNFTSQVISYQSYYPFGSLLPDFNWNDSLERYGFQGMEKEINLLNSQIYSAKYWEYDSKISRRWNIDPVFKEFESPYSVLGNSPILLFDPTGQDTIIANGEPADKRNLMILIRDNQSDNTDWDNQIPKNSSFDFIEVTEGSTVKDLDKIVAEYIRVNDPTLGTILFESHGDVGAIGIGSGISYTGAVKESDPEVIAFFNSLNLLAGNMQNQGDIVLTACYAGQKAELGLELGLYLLKSGHTDISLWLNSDYTHERVGFGSALQSYWNQFQIVFGQANVNTIYNGTGTFYPFDEALTFSDSFNKGWGETKIQGGHVFLANTGQNIGLMSNGEVKHFPHNQWRYNRKYK